MLPKDESADFERARARLWARYRFEVSRLEASGTAPITCELAAIMFATLDPEDGDARHLRRHIRRLIGYTP